MAGRPTSRKATGILKGKNRREDVLKILLDFSRVLSETLLDGDINEVVAEHSSKSLSARYVSLFLPDPEGKSLQPAAGYSLASETFSCADEPMTVRVRESAADPVNRAFVTKAVQVVDNVFTAPAGESFRDEAVREGYTLLAAVPMIHRGESSGVLCFCFDQPFIPDEDRVGLMTAIGQQAAIALANARFQEQMAGKNRQLSALLETSKGINSDLSLKTVLNSIASKAAELLGAEKSVVFLWNEEAQVLEIAAKKGLKGREYDGLTIVRGEGVAGKVAESRRPLIVNDYHSSAFRLERFRQTTAFMAAPIVKGSELLGVIGVLSEEEGVKFSRESLELLTLFALHAAIAVDNARLHQGALDMSRDLEKRATEISSLHRISRAASSSLDLDVLIEKASAEAAVIGVSRVAFCILDEQNGAMVLRSLYLAEEDPIQRFWKGASLSLADFRVSAEVLNTGRPAILDCDDTTDLTDVERWFYASQDIRSILLVPLAAGAEKIGLISFASVGQKKIFDDSAVGFCRMVADELSLAIQNARLHGETKEHLKRLNSLIGIIKSLDMTGDLDAAFTRSCTQIRRIFRTTGEAVCLVDPESRTLREFLSRGVAKKFPRLCEGIDCMLLGNGRTSLAYRDPEAVNCPAYSAGKGEFLCAALKCGDSVYGTIRIHSRNGAGFRNGDRQFLEAIGEQVAGLVERDRLLQQVTHMAITDPLTGLFNRREFLREFDESVTRAERYRRPLSFLMMDLDNFKSYNDTLGHQAGDTLLKEVTTLIKRYIRESDIFCRYGGDELCVILPETGNDEAFTMAERIRKAVDAHQFAGENQERGKITLTIGISSYPSGGKSRDELIQGADSALYRAKKRGRNRVFVYREEL